MVQYHTANSANETIIVDIYSSDHICIFWYSSSQFEATFRNQLIANIYIPNQPNNIYLSSFGRLLPANMIALIIITNHKIIVGNTNTFTPTNNNITIRINGINNVISNRQMFEFSVDSELAIRLFIALRIIYIVYPPIARKVRL